MVDPGWNKIELNDFGGSWTSIDPVDVPAGRSLLAQNAEFNFGQVSTRHGFGVAYAAAEIAYSLFNWISSLGSYLVWFLPGTGVRGIKISDTSPVKTTMCSILEGTAASFAPSGPRLYVGAFNKSTAAADQGHVISFGGGSSGITFEDVAVGAFVGTTYALTAGVNFTASGGGTMTIGTGTPSPGSGKYLAFNTVPAGPDTLTMEFVTPADGTTPTTVAGSQLSFILWDTEENVTFTTYDSSSVAIETRTLTTRIATFSGFTGNIYKIIFTDTGSDGFAIDNIVGTPGAVGVVFNCDKLFAPPITYTPGAPTEPLAGLITAGVHRLGYVIEHRSGFIGRPSPDTGVGDPSPETFTPVSFTSAGLKNLSWVLNTTWPATATKVHVIMSPASNPSLYVFVPGASADITGGTAQSVTIAWSIADDDLLSLGDDATDLLSLATQTVAGTGPILPSVIVPYGDRMSYVTTTVDSVDNTYSVVLVSDRTHYQRISLDQHMLQIPGQKDIVTAFVLNDAYYMAGPSWTYVTRDTGGPPVEWPAPLLVDGRRGTLSPLGVGISPAGTHAWVASTDGLYFFNGAYADLPISYYNAPEWNRINWNAAWCVKVVDDAVSKRVYVLAPLDAAVTPSHLLTWDYIRGLTAAKVSFSLDSLSGFSLGSMELVKNDLVGAITQAAGHSELWLGSSASASILRRKTDSDTQPWRDQSSAIAFQYDLSLLPTNPNVRIIHHYGGFIRAYGAGSLSVTARHLDGSWSQALTAITLAATPGLRYQRMFHRPGEQVSYRFATSALDAHATISGLEYYWFPYSRQR